MSAMKELSQVSQQQQHQQASATTAGHCDAAVKGGDDRDKSLTPPSTSSPPATAAGTRATPSGEPDKKPLHPCLVRVVAQLEMKPLWDEFHELGTEMIVTKAGR